MKNLLITAGLVAVGYMLYTHPTTKRVQQCMKSDVIVIDTDDIIDDLATKAKKFTKSLDKSE
jgi:hypothetical protein